MSQDVIIAGEDTLAIAQSERFPDVENKIYLLEPAATPLTAFLTQVKKIDNGDGTYKVIGLSSRTVYDPEFKEFEDAFLGIFDKVNYVSGYSSSATEIVVDNAKIFAKYDIIKDIQSGEQMRVTLVDYDANKLTVTRGFGSTAAAGITNDDDIMVIASAFAEHSKSSPVNTTKKVEQKNFTQIFRTAFDISGTLNASKTLSAGDPGQERIYQQKKYAIEHAKKIERAYIFGEKKESADPTSGKPVRSTGGIIEAIKTIGNVLDMSNEPMTETEFDKWLAETVFVYGSQEKKLLAGPRLISAIAGWAKDKLHIVEGDNTYGVRVIQYLSPSGTLDIIQHPEFTGPYAGIAIAVDLNTLKHCPLNGRDTALTTNLQTKDVDGTEDEYLTETGLERVNFEKNAMIINIGTES